VHIETPGNLETGSGKNYLQCTKVADLATEMRRELRNRSKEAAISKSIGFSQINLMLFFFKKLWEAGSMAVSRMADAGPARSREKMGTH